MALFVCASASHVSLTPPRDFSTNNVRVGVPSEWPPHLDGVGGLKVDNMKREAPHRCPANRQLGGYLRYHRTAFRKPRDERDGCWLSD